MDEHGFVKAVHRHLPGGVKVWKIKDDFHGGVPDALYFGTAGQLLFVEYKYQPKLPVKNTTLMFKGSVSPLQYHWFKDLKLRQIPMAFVLGAEKQAVILYTDKYIKGIPKAKFLENACSFQEIARDIGARLLQPE